MWIYDLEEREEEMWNSDFGYSSPLTCQHVKRLHLINRCGDDDDDHARKI